MASRKGKIEAPTAHADVEHLIGARPRIHDWLAPGCEILVFEFDMGRAPSWPGPPPKGYPLRLPPRRGVLSRARVASTWSRSPPGTVRCHQQAAFSYAGTMPFEVATDNLGDHRLRLGPAAPGALGEHRRATISVEAIPLDALERTFTTPLAVKIDTQGAEPFVLAGAPKTLARTGLLICEFWPYAMHRLGGDPDAVIAALVEHFPHASLGPGPAQPMATAARTLAQFALRHRADAAVQMDVVAWR